MASEATLPADDVQMWVRRGLQAAHAGDHAEAKRCFQSVRAADPDNTAALLWLAWLSDDQAERLALLGRVLELEPGNERARAGLRWARRRVQLPTPSAPSTLTYDLPIAGATAADEAPDLPAYRKVSQAAPPPRRLRAVLTLLLAIALLAIVAWLAWYRPFESEVAPLAATSSPATLPSPLPTGSVAPASIPAAMPTYAATPVLTATAPSTGTATRRPTSTPAATATHTAAPTSTSAPAPTAAGTPAPSPSATPLQRVSTATPTPAPDVGVQ